MSLTISDAEDMIAAVRDRWVSLGRDPDTLYMYDNHIKGAAEVARTIALKIGTIDPERIYISALLHDIAKIDESPESMVGRFHGLLGYELLKDKDSAVARACLLHEFPWNKIPPFEKCSKKLLNNKNDYAFMVSYVAGTSLNDEDLVIQLADGMANKNGIVTLEQRQREYEQRFNFVMPSEMAEPYLEIKRYLDNKIGGNIYDLFF